MSRRVWKLAITALGVPCLALAQSAASALAPPTAADAPATSHTLTDPQAAIAVPLGAAGPAPSPASAPLSAPKIPVVRKPAQSTGVPSGDPPEVNVFGPMSLGAVFSLAQAGPPPSAAGRITPAAGGNVTILPEVTVIGATPLLGSGVDRYKVPAENQVLTGRDITLEGPPSYLNALQDQAEGVHLENAAGNPFQPELFYHGFQASPLQGTPQGLAVYLNGARFNNPFGDTVDWELIPDIAIDRMNLEGANPVFGLNALGGSLSIQMKNGFGYHGAELDVFGGSFGQVAGTFQYGKQSGNTAVYVAAAGLHEGGWRDFQSSGLQQFYGDIGWRGDRGEVHLNIDLAQTVLDGPGTVPVELLDADRHAQFTGPNWIKNYYGRINLNGSFDINDTTSVQALAYYDNLLQRVANGNGSPLIACNDGSGLLCESGGGVATDRNGNPIPDFLMGGLYGSLAVQTTNTNGYGTSLQVSNKDAVFGLPNHLVAGFSFDGADTLFDATTFVGALDPVTRNFLGPDIAIALSDGSIAPVRAGIVDAYYGLYFADTLDITRALSASVSGRFNAAQIDIEDLNGTSLTGNHVYNRFNPAFGLTYKLSPAISLYGSYAESNRAPTPAELTCSDPSAPCSLANFFTGDPDLKQVLARSIEFGLRGQLVPYANAKLNWNLSAFHTNLDDDIIFVQSQILGTGFFQNVGSTRRQGIDAGLRLTSGRWLAWIDYSYTDATFRNAFTEPSPNNPNADANGNISVRPGDRLPGIPAHQLKLGVQYKATDKWTIGATAVAASGQYLFGDEANLTSKLPGYFLLNLNTSYQFTKNIQLFALVQNAFDARYFTYGTFSPTSSVPLVEAPNATNTRSYNIGPPIAAYAGVKIML